MKFRASVLTMVGLAVALTAAVATTAFAADEKTHEGIVVSFEDSKLTMTMKDGEGKHTHDIADNVPITLDGNPAKGSDLKAGMSVKVTTDAEGRVTHVAAMSAKPPQ